MANLAGRGSRLYAGATNASPVTDVTSFDFNFSSEFIDTTAMGDGNKTFLVDLPDGGAKIEAFLDDTYWTLMDAAFNQTLMKIYAYFATATATNYLYGEFYVSLDSVSAAIGAAIKQSFTIKPSGAVTLKHA